MKKKKHEEINVLAVDDSDDIIELIKGVLEIELIDCTCVNSAKEALNKLNENFDVIVLDLMMPDISGREFLVELRKEKKYSDIHIIILTAETNTDDEIGELFKLGANDYIRKPFFPAEFISRVRNHANIKQLTVKLRKYNSSLKRKNLKLGEIIKREEFLNKRILDRTFKLKKAYEKIEKLNDKLKFTSTHDKLTKLYNRGAILTFLQNDVQRVKRVKTSLSIMMLDLDFFKKVNDTYGHLTGDTVLSSVSLVLKNNIREIDLIGRYGGEEFIIILPDTNIEQAALLAERIIEKIRNNCIETDKAVINQTISIGITQYKKDETMDEFIERADEALYQAKGSGRNKYIIK